MSKSRWTILVALLAALNIYLFWPGSLYFLNDDFIHIPLSDQHQLFQTNSVRPLHELLVNLDLLLWQQKAWGFHLTALVLHFIVAGQLFWLCRVVQVTYHTAGMADRTVPALISVSVFLFYPQHAESLGWILGRTPILSAIFLLPLIGWFLLDKRGWGYYLLAMLAFAATLFTYEQAILVPVLFFALAYREKDGIRRRNKTVYALLTTLVGGAYILTRKLLTSQVIGDYEGGNLVAFNLQQLVANLGRLLARLLVNPSEAPTVFLISVLGMVLVVIAFIWLLRRTSISPGILFFCGSLILLLVLPVISLGVSTRSFESGRFLYLPSVFLALLLGTVFHRALQSVPRLAWWFLIAIAGYWWMGKVNASVQYKQASRYSRNTTAAVIRHFDTTGAPLRIDTLRTSVHQLPVFRLGFKEGLQWLSPRVDTGKIEVLHLSPE